MAKTLTGLAKTAIAKKRAWDMFSQWVRVKKGIDTTNYPFLGICVTCYKQFHIRALQAGHMIPGRSNAVLFQKELVNPQCVACNEGLHGRPKRYRKVMVIKYGEAKVARWEKEAKKVIHDRDMDFKSVEIKYREATRVLLIPFSYNNYNEMLQGHQS